MVEIERADYCTFHHENTSNGECVNCGLNICSQDEDYDAQANRLCPLCSNIIKSKPTYKYLRWGMYLVIVAAAVVVYVSTNNLWFAILPLILVPVGQIGLNKLMIYMYFKDIELKESILPVIRYFEASGEQIHYKLIMRFLEKMTEEDIKSMEDKIYEFLVPAFVLNYSKLPEDWEEKITKNLKISKEDFMKIITQKYRTIFLQIATHSNQQNMSEFVITISEHSGDEQLIADFIKELTSPDVMELDEDELNVNYGKLLGDFYLDEDKFYDYCDKLNLKKEKKLLSQLIGRFEPPPVPRNQLEAVMPTEQLIEKRKKEEEAPEDSTSTEGEEEAKELEAKEVEFKEE